MQLQRGLTNQDENAKLDALIPADKRWLSYELRAKKPSERLFRAAVDALLEQGIEAKEILHVGSRMTQDLIPAKRWGCGLRLFAGDEGFVRNDAGTVERRPESAGRYLLTELNQITEVV